MGIRISRNRANLTLTLSQEEYVEKIAGRFLPGAITKTFSTPVHHAKLDQFTKITCANTDEERAAMRDKPYMSLMGSLLWATVTRPDIAYYISFLCQFMQDPSLLAFEAALAVLCYLYATRKLGITYNGNMPFTKPFSDSSWGQTPVPFGGHAILFCGGAVTWSARKLKIVPQSSAEAEIAVYTSCAKDLKFVVNLLKDLGITLAHPIEIHCDNSAAVSNVKNVGTTARTRHYERWIQLGREQYLERFSLPTWISTKDQIADIFTKPLDKTTFLKFRAALLNLDYDFSAGLFEILEKTANQSAHD